MDIPEHLIFGRYTREECGLLPEPVRRPGPGRLLYRAVLLLLALVAAGWLAGGLTARWRAGWLAALPYQVSRADNDLAGELLSRGRKYATALPGNRGMRRDLAFAAALAAERAPRRFGYYANVKHLHAGLDGGEPASAEAAIFYELTVSGVQAELGDFAAAFAALDRAEKHLGALPDDGTRQSFRLLLVNSRAYCLATAPAGSGRDPERALHLAELMISSRDPLPGGGHASGSAALLDTLAAAYHAAGLSEKAIATQSLALGLADPQGLDVYVHCYDELMDDAVSPKGSDRE